MASIDDEKRRLKMAQGSNVNFLSPASMPKSFTRPKPTPGPDQPNVYAAANAASRTLYDPPSPLPPPDVSIPLRRAGTAVQDFVQSTPVGKPGLSFGSRLGGAARMLVDSSPQLALGKLGRQATLAAIDEAPAFAGDMVAGFTGVPADSTAVPSTTAPSTAAPSAAKVAAPRTNEPSYSMDNVPEGGGYISWDSPMGENTLGRIAPDKRDMFRRPGSISITPEQAKSLSSRVNTVPAGAIAVPSTNDLVAARQEAVNRGDFEGVRRSLLSSDALDAENRNIYANRANAAQISQLESRARDPVSLRNMDEFLTSVGNRRQAGRQLGMLYRNQGNSGSSLRDQIDLEKAKVNQIRAYAALNRPKNFSIETSKIYDGLGQVIGERRMLFDPESGALTPLPDVDANGQPTLTKMDPRLEVKAAEPSEDDINETMKQTGLTREQVLAELAKLRG